MQLDKKSLSSSDLTQLAKSGQMQVDAVRASDTKLCNQFLQDPTFSVPPAEVWFFGVHHIDDIMQI